jgi:putative hydrolase of the HAD superfamily
MEPSLKAYMPHPFDTLSFLSPISTEAEPHLDPIKGIEAVVFDVYGTLLISASGDIGSQNLKGNIALKSFHNAGLKWTSNLSEEALGLEIISEYERQIHLWHSEAKERGLPHPEVDIVVIWEKSLEVLKASIDLRIEKEDGLVVDYRELSIHFEVCNNAVFPMPNMEPTLAELSSRGYALGIVSNAQFFTPMVLNHFMNESLNGDLPYFRRDLQVYSYELGRAKPDRFLYDRLSEQLEAHSLSPQQCLYVGNDMLNDVYPAQQAGFKTVLFAGDQRSLRMRSEDLRCKDLQPDRTITSLDQIPTLLG